MWAAYFYSSRNRNDSHCPSGVKISKVFAIFLCHNLRNRKNALRKPVVRNRHGITVRKIFPYRTIAYGNLMKYEITVWHILGGSDYGKSYRTVVTPQWSKQNSRTLEGIGS